MTAREFSADPTPGEAAVLEFYVSVIDGARTGLLLGPFGTHEEAKANVERGRKLAEKANDRAVWFAFGTASAPRGTTLTAVFGK